MASNRDTSEKPLPPTLGFDPRYLQQLMARKEPLPAHAKGHIESLRNRCLTYMWDIRDYADYITLLDDFNSTFRQFTLNLFKYEPTCNGKKCQFLSDMSTYPVCTCDILKPSVVLQERVHAFHQSTGRPTYFQEAVMDSIPEYVDERINSPIQWTRTSKKLFEEVLQLINEYGSRASDCNR